MTNVYSTTRSYHVHLPLGRRLEQTIVVAKRESNFTLANRTYMWLQHCGLESEQSDSRTVRCRYVQLPMGIAEVAEREDRRR